MGCRRRLLESGRAARSGRLCNCGLSLNDVRMHTKMLSAFASGLWAFAVAGCAAPVSPDDLPGHWVSTSSPATIDIDDDLAFTAIDFPVGVSVTSGHSCDDVEVARQDIDGALDGSTLEGGFAYDASRGQQWWVDSIGGKAVAIRIKLCGETTFEEFHRG